jgi:8-oxo-dGTP diphosphatase
MIMFCDKKCCNLHITEYTETEEKIIDNTRRYKAGIILHNIHEDKILIVQSRGNLWGFPKGSFEEGETFQTCAVRELKEETGVIINIELLQRYYKVNDYVMYFYVPYYELNNINIQKTEYNDANGIGWVNIDCLEKLLKKENFNINFHAKKCLQKYFRITFN